MDQWAEFGRRADGRKWPENDPKGWVFFGRAVERIAYALCRPWNDFYHVSRFAEMIPPLDDEGATPEKRIRAGHIRQRCWDAVEKRRRVVEFINEALVSGDLAAGFAPVGYGEVQHVKSAGWFRTDDPLLRFRTYSIDVREGELASEQVSLPNWLYVLERDLKKVIARANLIRRGSLGKLPEPGSLIPIKKMLEANGGTLYLPPDCLSPCGSFYIWPRLTPIEATGDPDLKNWVAQRHAEGLSTEEGLKLLKAEKAAGRLTSFSRDDVRAEFYKLRGQKRGRPSTVQ